MSLSKLRRSAALLALAALFLACQGTTAPATAPATTAAGVAKHELLDTVSERTFRWFWDLTNPANGLVPDRWPTPSFSSVAAVGFGLTAYGVGVERGYVTREEARQRVLSTLRFFSSAPQGPSSTGVTGYKGFFYH